MSDSAVGFQFGCMFNNVEERVRGFQLSGIANIAGDLHGVQVSGIHNYTNSGSGLQIGGVINIADNLVGLQIGVLNFNNNGFLPFFPIFNFGFAGANEESEASED